MGISSRPGAVFPALRIALRMSATVTGGKLILRVAVVGESKGISPASAVFVRRFRTRMSRFSSMPAARPRCRFCGSVNGGLR